MAAPVSAEAVWRRIEACAGTDFRTVRGIRFTYAALPRTVRLLNTNRSISRTQVERALERWPVSSPKELHDLQGPSYLFAILADVRVLGRG